MALKRKTKVSTEFSLAAMTDIMFQILLFFMIALTVVHTDITNKIKVALPQSANTESKEKSIVRIVIDKSNNIFIAKDRDAEIPVTLDEVEPFLQQIDTENDMYVALYADETLPYSEVVRVLDIANRNEFKLVLATRPYSENK
ncbi:MAG: biopolymer transporter ExbD [Prevotellaceae bacterium]|jgi:biopolymer transport protein ExbD|nr:biopolymer transporter ExbD [Prevotellaceae bacterium]GHT34608.1 biopolymer transporter ExbD [Bacteroidia bacterium]